MAKLPDWIKYKQYPLSHYIERLATGKYFGMPVYGDAELMCMINNIGKWCRSHLSDDNHLLLKSTFKNNINNPNMFYSTSIETMYRCLRGSSINSIGRYFESNKDSLQDINWHNGRVILLKFIEGKLFPLIEQLRKMRVVVIGNKKLKILKDRVFDYDYFIEVMMTPQQGFESIGMIEGEILRYKNKEDTVFLLACGHAAPVIVQRLFPEMPNNYIIDVGKGFDYFCDHGMSVSGLLNIPKDIKKSDNVPMLSESMIEDNLR